MKISQLKQYSQKKRVEVLFKTYGKQLFRYGHFQWKLEKDAAWDMVYKTLYKIEETFERYSFNSEKEFQGFVFKVYVNYLKNNIRDEETKRKGTSEIELKEESIESPKTKNEESKEVSILNSILDELEDWQRILLLMRAQEYSYSDIAKYTNKSEKNLKVYYGRLKNKVAKKMEVKLKNVLSDEK